MSSRINKTHSIHRDAVYSNADLEPGTHELLKIAFKLSRNAKEDLGQPSAGYGLGMILHRLVTIHKSVMCTVDPCIPRVIRVTVRSFFFFDFGDHWACIRRGAMPPFIQAHEICYLRMKHIVIHISYRYTERITIRRFF